MKKTAAGFALALCSFCTIAQTSKDTVEHITLDSLVVTANPGQPIYRAAATRVWEIKNTRIALSFNYGERTADAREWITMHPYFYPTDTVVLDAKSMRIDSVLLVTKKGNKPLDFTYQKDQLKIRFGQVYKTGETVELYLRYTAMPYRETTGGSGAIQDDRGLYFINTDRSIPHKPVQIWTQGETESNSHWMITIDKPNTRFTTQVELTVPDSFVTLSNGALIRQIKGTKGLRTDIWRMDMPIQAYVAMFAIGKFSIVKDSWHNKEVNYYVEPEYAKDARLMFNHTKEMLEYFSKRTGVFFPWNKYSQVVVRDYVSGAMENTTAALFGEFMNQNAREIADRNFEDVVSHELFHEWFGDYVTCESWSNITVNESFANYGEQLWRRHYYGDASADELAYNDLYGYISAAALSDPQLVRYYYDNREEVFDAISYNKGGAILGYMNSVMGDAAFDRAMNIYLTKNALHGAEAQNWRMAVEEATGQDWNWFFNEWYYHAGHPVLKIVYHYNDTTQQLMVAVMQSQADSTFMYQLPLKAAVIYGHEKTVADWNISKRRDTFVYAYRNGVAPVIVPDYTHVLPGEVRDGKKLPQWRVQFRETGDFISKRLAVSAAGRQLSDSNAQAIMDMAFADPINGIRRYALSQMANATNEKYHKRWASRVTAIAMNDSNNVVRAEAFHVLGEWKVTAAKEAMLAAVHSSSYMVAGEALDALLKIDKDTAYALAKQLVDTDPRSDLESAVWSAIGKKAADADIALYERYGPYAFGLRRFSFVSSLGNYLKNVSSDESFRRGVAVLASIVTTESLKTYRTMFGGYLFQLASDEKGNTQSDKKEDAATARKRLDIILPALQQINDKEKEPEIQKENKKKLKELEE